MTVRTRASRASADGQRQYGGAVFYYFLVGVDGRPYLPAVLTADTADRRLGEVIVLADGSRVRVRAIEELLRPHGIRELARTRAHRAAPSPQPHSQRQQQRKGPQWLRS